MHRSGLIELETVLAVARLGSFRAAARQLGMSTSAVSSAVAGLEARLRARLFHRTTRSVALTEAGQRYVQRIAPAVAEIRGANEDINSQPEAPAGTLRINAPRDAVRMIFEPLLLEYLHRYPQVNLDIVSEERMIDIVADGFDAGIRLAEAVPRDMVSVPLSEDLRMVVVGSPAYFAEHGKPRVPDDLTGHAAIRMRLSHGGLYRWELERRGEALEIDLPPRVALNDQHTVRQAARAGIGLAFLSEWHIADDLASGHLVTVLDDWCPSFPGLRLYYPRHRYVPAGLKALVELIREKNIGRRAAR
ncbi:LysR family transcriptional regulator [Archangium violaceum]|uniref:LysR family transcriptional regulator n=1 Tax=Archangium violaceum TaxID=83451 RepID=UPI0019521FE5|nr:LysR family transcriptional regulator [Archangium violaceum]QRO02117.1 LysR family transcriptional regulator [Archangium violaceum]